MKDLALPHGQYHRAALIYNPVAGRLARGERLLQRTIAVLEKQGISTVLVPTTGPSTASGLARRQIDQGCDLILAAGGDGTINEVLNGMVHSGVPLGILPGGTANVLAKELRVSFNLEKAAAHLSDCHPQKVSLGKLCMGRSEPRYFLLMAGIGLDAHIIYQLNLDLKAVAGKLAYYVSGGKELLRAQPQFPVWVDGKQYECGFALVSRVRNYGGDFELARGASLLNNEFEVALFEGRNSFRYVGYFFGMLLGRAEQMKGCTVLKAKQISCGPCDDPDVYVQIDGESVGRLPASMEIVPDALTLLMPRAYLKREAKAAGLLACA